MRIVLAVALLLWTGPMANAAELPPPPDLTPDAKARLVPLFDGYETLNKELAALPPAKNDAERLLRLKRRDDFGRTVIRQIDFGSLPAADAQAAMMAAQIEIERQGIENQTQLKAMLPQRGWFLRSEIGAEASSAAWLIIHHAINTDMALVRQVLGSMNGLLATGEIEKPDYAMLADRVAVVDGVRQSYGTQMICNQFKWALYPVADEANVEARRKDMGIGVTLADQLAQFASRTCPVANYEGSIPK